jgi:hypothetical protein
LGSCAQQLQEGLAGKADAAALQGLLQGWSGKAEGRELEQVRQQLAGKADKAELDVLLNSMAGGDLGMASSEGSRAADGAGAVESGGDDGNSAAGAAGGDVAGAAQLSKLQLQVALLQERINNKVSFLCVCFRRLS